MTFRSVALAAALALLVPAALSQAPPEIRPGHTTLDTTPIRAGVDSLAIFYFDGDEVFAIGTYVIEIGIEQGRITRTERMLGLQDEFIWGEEQLIEDRTLAPVSSIALGGRDDELQVEDAVVTRRWTSEGEEHTSHAAIETGAFLPGPLDLVLRSLPLEEGYAATLAMLETETLEEVRIPIHVERAIALADATGTQRRSWEVHVDLDGAIDVYHIEQETHALVRYESAMEGLVMLRW